MTLSPSEWRIHALSTRDLADRMLVRGDAKGAQVMLQAAGELEKRHKGAIIRVFFASFNRGIVDDFEVAQSASRLKTAMDMRTDGGASYPAAPTNDDCPPSLRTLGSLVSRLFDQTCDGEANDADGALAGFSRR
jgi:hypothetical protein